MNKRRGEAVTKDLLYRVLAILYRYSEEIAVLEHPRSIERRSVDLAVRLRDGRRVLVKVAHNLQSIPRTELAELAALSETLGIPALIVARMRGETPLLEGVMYERYGIPSVSPETLDNVLSGRELVYIRVDKESYTVSIDGEMLRRKRIEKNLSLGDIALMLGVSRRTVYEYEKGTIEPSIDKAEKLIQLLGDEIAKPIDLFRPVTRSRKKQIEYDTPTEQELAEILECRGYKVAHVKRTVIDIAAGKGDDEVTIVVEHPSRRSGLLDKVYYMSKLASAVNIEKAFIVVESSRTGRMLEKEGFTPVTVDDLAEVLRELGERERRGRKDNENETA